MIVAVALAVAAVSAGNCIGVDSDRILASHLAERIPAFAGVPPDLQLGFAANPGLRRVFEAAELERILAARGVTAAIDSRVCFEWKLNPLDSEALGAAMTASLAAVYGAASRVEVIEFSKAPAPEGEMIFPLTTLPSRITGAPAIWRGHVRYSGNRRFDVWARVRIHVPCMHVVATEPLPSATPIAGNQIHAEACDGIPDRNAVLSTDEVIGRVPRRHIPAGGRVLRPILDRAMDVARGELVRVEVRTGAARIEMEGKAETAGRVGDRIPIRNSSSGRVFRGLVTAPGRVVLNGGGE